MSNVRRHKIAMPDLTELELLRGDTAVHIAAMKRDVTISFATREEEVEYEQQDWRLHTDIQLVVAAEIGAEESRNFITMHEDWFPNKTKSLRCDQAAISAKFIGALQCLLRGEFATWSISIEVYGYSDGQQQDIGPIKVYAEKVFAVQALGARLVRGA
jgi:hypothetical protein